jgi:hypothetical protein
VEDRTIFLRRANPQRSLGTGRRLFSLRDVLVSLHGPVLGFDEDVDLIVHGDTITVLSQPAFASVFRHSEALVAQVPQWIAEIGLHVPIGKAAAERLGERAHRDSRIRGRLEAIARRGHLAAVTGKQLRLSMIDHGLDPTKLLDSRGRIVFADGDIATVVQFLNEDLFVGGLSSTPFRADRKQAR